MPDAYPDGTMLVLEPILGPPLQPIPFGSGVGGASKTIGRAPECDVQLPETEKTVSRKHCRIDVNGAAWTITDLSSRFGTMLNETPAAPGTATPFRDGDRIRVGPWTFRVSSPAGTSAERTSHGDTVSTETAVVKLPRPGQDAFDKKRLETLLRTCKKLLLARDEIMACEPALEALVEHSGYSRAALIRPEDNSGEKVDVLGIRSAPGRDESIQFSRSLLLAALVQSSADGLPSAVAATTADRGQAIAVPLKVAEPKLILYIDRRGGDPPAAPDAAALVQTLAEMVGSAVANTRRASVEAERRAANEQIESAMSLQVQMLPNPKGKLGRVQYAMQVKPSKAVGGDSFDILALDHRRVAFFISDVSGRGLPAAILAATTQSYIAALLRQIHDPAEVLDAANTYLVNHAPDDKFVSLWLGILDTQTGLLRYCDAGHSYWLLRHPNGVVEKIREGQSGGPPLRVTEGLRYHSSEVSVQPGARIVLYSDGLIEQTGRDKKAFGTETLMAALKTARSAEEDVASIFREVARFGGADNLNDDLTVASVEYLPE